MINYESLAKKVADAVRINPKPNPGIERARRDFGNELVKKLLSKKVFTKDDFPENEFKKIKKLTDFKYGPLVYEIDNKYKVKTKIGETIRIAYNETDPRCVKLAKALRNEIWSRGCHVIFSPTSDADSKLYYKKAPEHTHAELPPISELMARNIDARIYVGDNDDVNWSHGFEKLLKLSSPSSQRLWNIMDRRKVRWCILGFPVKRKDYVVDRKTYERVYILSLIHI